MGGSEDGFFVSSFEAQTLGEAMLDFHYSAW